jgi:prepilin-type processing-associated H-X9-DG protein
VRVDERYEPTTIDVAREEGVMITFVDGHVARFDLPTLRAACPCAFCRRLRDEGEAAWPRPESPTPLRIENAELHGGWGLRIVWNDGHGTGIFPFESLRRWDEGGAAFGPDSGLGGGVS